MPTLTQRAANAGRACEQPALRGAHVVIATHQPPTADFAESPWWRLGLTNARLIRYVRTNSTRAGRGGKARIRSLNIAVSHNVALNNVLGFRIYLFATKQCFFEQRNRRICVVRQS